MSLPNSPEQTKHKKSRKTEGGFPAAIIVTAAEKALFTMGEQFEGGTVEEGTHPDYEAP